MNLKKRFHVNLNSNKSTDKSFYSTLSFSFLIVSIISTVLLGIVLISVFVHSMTTTAKNYNEQLLSQTNYAIDKINADAARLRSSLMGNNRITAFLSLSDSESTVPVLAKQEVEKQLLVMPYVENICLYNADMDLLYSSTSGYQQPLEYYADSESLSRLADPDFLSSYKGQPVPGQLDPDTKACEIISYYFWDNYGQDSDKKSAIVVNFDISVLFDPISSMKDLSFAPASNFVLLDQNGNFLTGVLNSDIEDREDWMDDALDTLTDENIYVSIQGKTYLKTETNANAYGWNLVNYTPVSVILQDSFVLILLSLLIMILVLIICWFVCRSFAKRLNRPLEILTHIVKGNRTDEHRTFETKEFRTIMDTVSTLHENNEQLRSLQHKSRYSLIQSTLNDLVSDHHLNPPRHLRQQLDYLGLSYIETEKLCMAVFKIDSYKNFITEHSSDEMWVLRFSVVNIVEELGAASFTCNAFSHDDDKFILLVKCSREEDLVAFEEKLLELLRSIQENLNKYLHFTVTAAYSPIFQGLNQLPVIYKRTEDSLKLKMRYGHNCIIEPYQPEEQESTAFHFSQKLFIQLCDQLLSGQFSSAWNLYGEFTDNLFESGYSEITTTIIHLTLSIYERLSEKYPMLQETFMNEMKTVLTNLESAEVIDDIHALMRTYFQNLCSQIQQVKANPAQQNSALLADRIGEIIREKYTDPSLCLAGIAEEIGLSANYTGHIFKQHTQKSVAQYLLEVRMDHVAQYLQTTSLPLGKILERVGLEKNNYFYTRFKNYFGMSLGEYRQKFQTKEN